jgi:hypothetical protein
MIEIANTIQSSDRVHPPTVPFLQIFGMAKAELLRRNLAKGTSL